MEALAAFATALAAALLLTPVCMRIAWKTGFLAHPSNRGVHREPTPLLGGVAIFFAVVFGMAAGGMTAGDIHFGSSRLWGFLVGGTLIFAMGVLDDRYNLGWFSKLLVQFIAGVLLLAGGNVGPFPLFTPAGLLLSLLWIVGLANAMNFLDNMDGIAAGIAAAASLAFAGLALLMGESDAAFLAAAVAGASIGFLRYNFSPARIFLGDAGSLFLGYALACSGLAITDGQDSPFALLIPVLVVGYPIFDITFVSVTRSFRGQSLTQGGKDHSSHRLARILGGARPTAWAIYAICAALGIAAILLHLLSFSPATIVVTIAALWGFVAFGGTLCRRAPVPEEAAAAGTARVVP
jgi:UDP-GlcNAc:undecaprenyl-phosphate GlcNAc-1-phosphate transferase